MNQEQEQEAKQEQSKKAKLYKNMFLISTFFGIAGVICLVREVEISAWLGIAKVVKIAGWAGVIIWLILAVAVRIMVIRDKNFNKDKKI
ncbi:MAG: hypothetical protein LBN20_00510 [Endomicrobium sp.]|jgi:hypothetical protein|nr:hypothetical protein [Endomicrobium sp.]